MPEFVCEPSGFEGGDDNDRPAVIPEDEVLEAEVTRIKQITKPYKDDDNNDVKRVEFSFLVEDGQGYDGRRIKGDTPTTFSENEKCRLRNWAQEIMGVEIPSGFKLNTDDLEDSKVRIVVGQRKYTKDNEERIYNFVKDLMRTKGGKPATPSKDWVEDPF